MHVRWFIGLTLCLWPLSAGGALAEETAAGVDQLVPDAQPFSLAGAVTPGSALDVSGWLHRPAGSKGFVQADGEALVFADGTPARFHGVNICWEALYPDHEQAVAVAEHLSRAGVNIVRLTYLDSPAPRGLVAADAATSDVLDPAQWDRLDRFCAELTARGIYLMPVLSMGMGQVRVGDGWPDTDAKQRAALAGTGLFVEPRVEDLVRRQWQAMLTHVNPYTQRSWLDDPAVAWIEILNEHTLFYLFGKLADLPQPNQDALQARWNAWLLERFGSAEGVRATLGEALEADWSATAGTVPLDLTVPLSAPWRRGQAFVPDPLGAARHAFFSELNAAGLERSVGYLRELGVRSLVAPTGGGAFVAADRRAQLAGDLFCQHSYHDHPSFEDGLRYRDTSALKAGLGLTRGFSVGPNAGQPYGISEYDYCFPNQWRAEGGPILAAYGSLQGWSALVRFAYYANSWDDRDRFYAGGDRGVRSVWRWHNDPAVFGQQAALSLLYLRGDVAPARQLVHVGVSAADSAWPEAYRFPSSYLGFLGDAQLQHRFRLAMFDQAYTGDADLVINSGRSGSGDYSAAARAVLVDLAPAASASGGPAQLVAPARSVRVAGEQATAAAVQAAVHSVAGEALFPARQDGAVVSDTGEISYWPEPGRLAVVTPRTILLAGHGAGEQTLGPLTVNVANDFATVILTSLTDQPVEASDRLLLTAVGRCQNADFQRLTDAQGRHRATGASLGQAPPVIEPIRLSLSLPRRDGRAWQIWALDAAGNRVQTVPADGIGEQQPATIYYELTPADELSGQP